MTGKTGRRTVDIEAERAACAAKLVEIEDRQASLAWTSWSVPADVLRENEIALAEEVKWARRVAKRRLYALSRLERLRKSTDYRACVALKRSEDATH
jgi:hypothetical protein